jgi:hypothetical protein
MGVRRIPLKPNALNGGKAHVPKDHNGYIEPGSYEFYKKTSVFADGAILFKELHLTLPAQNPDGSRAEPSGRGLFPDVTAQDSKRNASTGWGMLQLPTNRGARSQH